MPRFQIILSHSDVQKAMAYLVMVRGLSPEDAAEIMDTLLLYTHDKEGERYYTLFESAEGINIFTLKKKYRVLFGSGIQIIQLD